MIECLRIRDLALAREVEIEFHAGLNVLTGETGAGKSLVLSALSLLSGERADASAVRSGAEAASVEAIFNTEALPDFEADLAERGFPVEDHRLVVSRVIAAEGRSRAQVGGHWVPATKLRELFEGALEVSSQHASQRLRKAGSHSWFLDDFAGLEENAKEVLETYEQLRQAREELAALRETSAERERRSDFLRFQCEEIDAAEIRGGEFAEVGDEHRRLAHAGELEQGIRAAMALLAGEERGAVRDQLDTALRELEAVLTFAPDLDANASRLRALREEIEDLSLDFERAADRIEADPARLSALEERLERLEGLRRKYGGDEDAIAAHRETIGAELSSIGGEDERIEALEATSESVAADLAKRARALGAARKKAGAALAKEVERELTRLEMPDSRFEVALDPIDPPAGFPCGPGGGEQVAFNLAANPGEAPRPLHKVASGGELSRVFLALKKAHLKGRAPSGMVLVFDEVDTGIGGRAIDQVGALLAELGAVHQVLCITHWPQIAAAAANHLKVAKASTGSAAEGGGRRTETAVSSLGTEERVEELARMAGGAKISEATRRHARDLLEGRTPSSGTSKKKTSGPKGKGKGRSGRRLGAPRAGV